MKPWTNSLVVVTATADLQTAKACIATWQDRASFSWPLIVVVNGCPITDDRPEGDRVYVARYADFLGSVPAFAYGVRMAAELENVRYIACLHDDLEIQQPGWDALTISRFTRDTVGLVGFSGASGLGSGNIYQVPYDPMQLARQGFMSNMRDAELHGERVTKARRVACCDGFSLVGRAKWWCGADSPWEYLANKGVMHHAYDSWMGLLAAKRGYEVWYEPNVCHHYGGRTAVGNADYSRSHDDQRHWETAHRAFYEDGRSWLPLRVS